MSVFQSTAFDDHETVTFFSNSEAGLRGIIAIHDTRRGPALGGCRYWAYPDDASALTDALRLSRGMTFKAAMAGLPYGGGKSVIIADPAIEKTPALMRAFGEVVDGFGGRYVVAEDVGTSPADMAEVARRTNHVAGLVAHGGDPSEATAHGVWRGIHAAVRHASRRNSLNGARVAVQGLGHVGWHLCALLRNEGAELVVGDIRPERMSAAREAFGAIPTVPEEILFTDADVLAPCALGAIIDDDTIDRINAPIVAGSANNQLAESRHGEALHRRGVLFAPDYVINAGGLINVHHELSGNYDRVRALADVGRIESTLDRIFTRSRAEGMPPHEIADRMAREILAA